MNIQLCFTALPIPPHRLPKRARVGLAVNNDLSNSASHHRGVFSWLSRPLQEMLGCPTLYAPTPVRRQREEADLRLGIYMDDALQDEGVKSRASSR